MNTNETSSASALQLLNKSELHGRQFTIYGTADSPLFLAKEVAEVIEHTNVTAMTASIDEDERVIGRTKDSLGRENGATFVTEDGLYEILMQSRKPIAKEFKRGVKAILKEIRTKGGYIAAAPEETPEQIMAKALRVADETLKRQQEQLNQLQERNQEQQVLIQAKDEQIEKQTEDIKHLTPIAEYTKEVLQSTTDYTLTQIAKDLGFRSVHTFTKWLTDNGIMYRQSGQWIPNSKYSGQNYFRTRTCKYVKSDDTIGTSITTVITEKGRAMLHIRLDKERA